MWFIRRRQRFHRSDLGLILWFDFCRVPETAPVGHRANVSGSGPGEDARSALQLLLRRLRRDSKARPWSHPTPPSACRHRAAGMRPGPRLFSRSGECGAGKRRPGTGARSARWVSGSFTATSDQDRSAGSSSPHGLHRGAPSLGQPAPLPRQGRTQKSAPPGPSLRARPVTRPRARLRELGISPSGPAGGDAGVGGGRALASSPVAQWLTSAVGRGPMGRAGRDFRLASVLSSALRLRAVGRCGSSVMESG